LFYIRRASLVWIFMKSAHAIVAVLLALAIVATPMDCPCAECGPRVCLPDRPVPPESVGAIPVPFDVPIWPTIIKTEFNILPWITIGKASVCLPGTCTPIEFPAPCLSLKPIPFWFPWLRPLDTECSAQSGCSIP
jgi:hypothetical protein